MTEEYIKIQKIDVEEIKPANYNPRLISNSEFDKLKNSINEFGLVDPIIVNLKNNTIIGGHQRYDALVDEGISELHLLKLGNIGWAFVDTDMDVLDETHEKALNIALNKISGEWDEGKLKELLYDLQESGFDIDTTGFEEIDIEEMDMSDEINTGNYVTKLYEPHYEITGDEPDISELVDISKTTQLIEKINSVDIDEETKQFLIWGAYRHLKFDYGKIAEFYAHQEEEVQELMEMSALVIIDYNKAIEEGYVKLSKKLKQIVGDL